MHRHRQLHLWITDHDYHTLRRLAELRQITLSAAIRQLIKAHRLAPVIAITAARRRPLQSGDASDLPAHGSGGDAEL